MSGPVFTGASHSTLRTVSNPPIAITEGAAGCPGGSVTSVTVIVTVTVAVPPLVSSALTMTV